MLEFVCVRISDDALPWDFPGAFRASLEQFHRMCPTSLQWNQPLLLSCHLCVADCANSCLSLPHLMCLLSWKAHLLYRAYQASNPFVCP